MVMNDNETPIGVKLKELREKAGMSQREVARRTGIAQSTFSSWERGLSEPNIETTINLCNLYGVDDILTELGFRERKIDMSELNPDEKKLIRQYRRLSPYLRETISDLVDKLADVPIGEKKEFVTYPVYDQSASAGTGHFLDSDHYEMLEFPESAVPPGATFGVRVSGDSMEPDYPDGSIVFVHHTKELVTGEIGVFILNGSAYIKRLGEKGLESINEKYKPRDINEYDSLRVVGKVIGYPYEK